MQQIDGAHDDLGVTQTERQSADAAPEKALPEGVSLAIDAWFGALGQSIGPETTTAGYNIVAQSIPALKRQIAAALDSTT